MDTYSKFQPTGFDAKGLGLDDRQAWLVLGVARNRGAGPLAESNFASALKSLGGESDTVEVHRFGHWGPGWYEIILIAPGSDAQRIGEEIEGALANYPVLDDNDHSEREQAEADLTWKNCYNDAQRLEWIREHREQFEFHGMADLMGCVRGKFFGGYASEMAGS